MTNTMEALWNGELAFCEHCGAHDARANELVCLMARSRDSLSGGLTEGQRAEFQNYMDRSEEYALRMMGMPVLLHRHFCSIRGLTMQENDCIRLNDGGICIILNRKLQICRKIILIPLVLGGSIGYNVPNPEKEKYEKERSI